MLLNTKTGNNKPVRTWTTNENQFIRDVYRINDVQFIAGRLKRSKKDVINQLIHLGLYGHNDEEMGKPTGHIFNIIDIIHKKPLNYLRGPVAEIVLNSYAD
jgi:hypothetical protein